MKIFFILIEIAMPLLALWVIWKKKELAIVYLPFLFFLNDMIARSLPAMVNYFTVSMMVGYFLFHNLTFIKRNIFSLLLVIHFFVLLPNSKDVVRIRPDFFASIVLFLLIPIIAEVYNKYPRERIFEELSKSSLLIMIFFIINTIFSTVLRYNPTEMYGITSGVLYGNIYLSDFNILSFASFIVIRKGIKDKSLIHIAVYVAAIFLVLLSFRRTAMGLALLGTVVVMIELLNFKQIKQFIMYGLVLGIVSLVIVYSTGFLDVFQERYELRKLDDRALGEEKRFMELELMYKDLFVYYDYSPWFGYELFDYRGSNYGKGIFGEERPLHSDYAVLTHSSGLIGLSLYILMMFVAISSIWRKTNTKDDYLQFMFCMIAFSVFFLTGRFSKISFMVMMFMIWYLPLAKNSKAVSKISESLKQTKRRLSFNS
jgi:O-antigen ligase